MTRFRSRGAPAALALLLLALGAWFAPGVRTSAPVEVGRIVSAVHHQASGTGGSHPVRVYATLRSAPSDAGAAGGHAVLTEGRPAVVVVALGLMTVTVLRRAGLRVPSARGRGPPAAAPLLVS